MMAVIDTVCVSVGSVCMDRVACNAYGKGNGILSVVVDDEYKTVWLSCHIHIVNHST
jgi:hypothetical protein